MTRHPVLRALLLTGFALCIAFAAVGYLAPFWLIDHAVRLNLWRSGVQSHFVTVDGDRIHYLEAKPRTAGSPEKPLLLIHGLGAKAEDWAPLLPALAARGYHVYAVDLLGYGRSARPATASFSIAEEESVVTGFMRVLRIESADVGGWSMGGWVAMRLAIEHPAMVRKLVLYDAAGIYFRVESPQTLFAPQTPAQFRLLAGKLIAKPMPSFLVDDGLRRFRRDRWVISRTVSAMTSGADLLDFRLGDLRRPTLIVWGGDDQLIPIQVGETLHREIAGSSFTMLPGCGHLAPVQCARPALAATLEFLEEHPVERAGATRNATVAQP